nr:hypothetical protein [Tanacetum cinerariifolium]
IEVYIEHGITALDSYLRALWFRATIEEITDEPEVITHVPIVEEVETQEISVEDVVLEDYEIEYDVQSSKDAGTDDDDADEDFLVDEENKIIEPDVDVHFLKLGSTSGIRACREALNKKKTTFTHKVASHKKMDKDSTYMVAASKVPMLKPVDEGVETTIETCNSRRKGINKAVEKRLRGNVATKKTQMNLLKQQYENFNASSLEVECRAPRSQDTKNNESTRRTVPIETPAFSALVSNDRLGGYDWSDQAEDGPTNFALMAYSSTSSNSKIIDKCITGLRYNVVPPPYTGNFMPPKPDFSGLKEFVNEPIGSKPTVKKPVDETSKVKASADKLELNMGNRGRVVEWTGLEGNGGKCAGGKIEYWCYSGYYLNGEDKDFW